MGVALISVVMDLPSGTWMTTSSARIVSPVRTCAIGNSCNEISLPSARRKVRTSRSFSGGRPGGCRTPTILPASRLKETGAPVLASNTTTPTGEVSIRVSRFALACCSLRCRRALAMTSAACEANITRVSSSSWVNSSPGSCLPT